MPRRKRKAVQPTESFIFPRMVLIRSSRLLIRSLMYLISLLRVGVELMATSGPVGCYKYPTRISVYLPETFCYKLFLCRGHEQDLMTESLPLRRNQAKALLLPARRLLPSKGV